MPNGEDGGRKYTQENSAPAESEPSVPWWRKPIRFLKKYKDEVAVAGGLAAVVNMGINFVSTCWGLGKKNVPEAKRQEGVA